MMWWYSVIGTDLILHLILVGTKPFWHLHTDNQETEQNVFYLCL